jgi:hypothetical protein
MTAVGLSTEATFRFTSGRRIASPRVFSTSACVPPLRRPGRARQSAQRLPRPPQCTRFRAGDRNVEASCLESLLNVRANDKRSIFWATANAHRAVAFLNGLEPSPWWEARSPDGPRSFIVSVSCCPKRHNSGVDGCSHGDIDPYAGLAAFSLARGWVSWMVRRYSPSFPFPIHVVSAGIGYGKIIDARWPSLRHPTSGDLNCRAPVPIVGAVTQVRDHRRWHARHSSRPDASRPVRSNQRNWAGWWWSGTDDRNRTPYLNAMHGRAAIILPTLRSPRDDRRKLCMPRARQGSLRVSSQLLVGAGHLRRALASGCPFGDPLWTGLGS